ncbi:c-type cytochrome [Ramlibacter tataouinensis]|uniref:Cytochrome c domain-containing protein n=1 Tax=Ramlibacter tataouinensis (strain ATCC BAA-407 / DSM 14655 / LMG 21543 / TTB310) TaxID=365046 RepID=F5Y129_RAMTT|nr:c-type cytochrome [Ramlibacter tataouinensis]AEG92247.1 hypothetical protein Rta_11610 [Ramlibacter tataouinensis TTB310]
MKVPPSLALLLACLIAVALAGCDRGEQAAAPAAGAASAPAAPASAPASAPAMAPPLVPAQVAMAAVGTPEQIEAGRQLATQGAGAAAACLACHGANGEGQPQTGFPRLAAQGRLYLAHQLDSYANGSRKHPVMSPIASAMNAEQRLAAAAYYASLGGAPAGVAPAAAPRLPPEPVLAGRGDESRQLQACANCHGPQGIGDAAYNPYLAGQHAAYLLSALAEWKSGARNNDPSRQMPAIAKALTDTEAKALATYYAALPAPAPRNAQAVAVAPGSAAGTASQSGPTGATAPNLGIGTEQGAPLTGGAQGQGVGGAATNPANTPNAPQQQQTPNRP